MRVPAVTISLFFSAILLFFITAPILPLGFPFSTRSIFSFLQLFLHRFDFTLLAVPRYAFRIFLLRS